MKNRKAMKTNFFGETKNQLILTKTGIAIAINANNGM